MERFVRAVGICTLVLILLIGISTIALTLLPKRGFRAELFSALRSGLKALVDKLEGVKGTPDSPIVVRGGSMTIRTRDPGGWVDEGNKSWCSDIPDLAYFAIVPEPTTVSPPTSFPDGSKLTINVRAGSSDDLQNGIQLVSQSGGCTENDQSPSSIKLSLIDNASSDFYPYSSSVNQEGGGKEMAKRFWNTNPIDACAGPNPKSTATGDEDVCERPSRITWTVSGVTSHYSCTNGECIVRIGNPY